MNYTKRFKKAKIFKLFTLALTAFLAFSGTVLAADISSISSSTNISVPLGTPLVSVNLPTDIPVTLSDQSTTSLPVIWVESNPVYNGDVANTYNFSGQLTLTGSTTNSSNLQPSVKVIVGSSTNATSTATSTPTATSTATTTNISSVAPIADINVASGTPLGSIGLPGSAKVTLDDQSTTTFPVTWNNGTPPYNPTATGTYAFSGTLSLTGSTTNTSNLKASVNVIVSSSTSTSTATSTATTTPSNTATSTATSTNSSSSSNPVPNSSAGGIGGRRQDISSLLAPGVQFQGQQGQVLGTSTAISTEIAIEQQMISIIQQLLVLLQRYASMTGSNNLSTVPQGSSGGGSTY